METSTLPPRIDHECYAAINALAADMPRLRQAIDLAEAGHRRQLRTGWPTEAYLNHPMRVALACRDLLVNAELPVGLDVVMAAAVLHDCLEDTLVTAEMIDAACGPEVLSAVRAMTAPPAGNRAQRQVDMIAQVKNAPDWVKVIKMQDRINNLNDIYHSDPAFWPHYSQETYPLLEVLGPAESHSAQTLADLLARPQPPVPPPGPARVWGIAEILHDKLGQPYLALRIPARHIRASLPPLRTLPGVDDAAILRRTHRDGSNDGHVTLITAANWGRAARDPEFLLRVDRDVKGRSFALDLAGFYQASDPKRPGRYASGLALSPDAPGTQWLNAWLSLQGLPSFDWHITLAIGPNGDVFGVPKKATYGLDGAPLAPLPATEVTAVPPPIRPAASIENAMNGLLKKPIVSSVSITTIQPATHRPR